MNNNKKIFDEAELDVRDWIRYAEMDIVSALRMSRQPYTPPMAKVCSECQQSAEKILKAYIIAKEQNFDYTHDLIPLIKKCQQYSPDFEKLNVACRSLTKYTTARYPPKNVSNTMVEKALKNASEIFVHTKSTLAEMGFTALNTATKFDEISTAEQIKKYMNSVHSVEIHPNVNELITKIVNDHKMTPAEVCQSLEEQLFIAGGVLRWNIEEHRADKHKNIVEKATLENYFVITRDVEIKDSAKENYILHYAYKNGNPIREGLFGEVRAIAENSALNQTFQKYLMEIIKEKDLHTDKKDCPPPKSNGMDLTDR